LLHSPGGHPEIAYQAMKFFKRRFRMVNIIVPLSAKSAATLMCLGADRIFMGEMADLGPVDIQIDDPVNHGDKGFSPIDEFKSMEFLREQALEWMDFYAMTMNRRYGMAIKEALKDAIPLVNGLMKPIFEQIDPIEMGSNRRAVAIGEEYARRMLALTDNDNAAKIVKRLVWGYPSHAFCIDFEEAKSIGLPVERLPEQLDQKLSDAIFDLERDDYHGFAQAPPPSQGTRPARPTTRGKARKQVRPPNVAPVRSERRVNGRDGSGDGERARH